MSQEKAYNDLEQKKYKNAITEVENAQKYFEISEANLDFFTANNEQLLGLSYYYLHDLKKSLLHYNKALEFTKNDPTNFLNGLIYNGFALVYLEQKDLPKAKKYLDLATKISTKSDYLELKDEIYTTSQKYFEATKDLKSLVIVQEKQDSVQAKITAKSTEFINDSFKKLEKTNHLTQEKSTSKNSIIIFALGLILCAGIYIIVSRKKHKKNLAHFQTILQKFESNEMRTAEILPIAEKNASIEISSPVFSTSKIEVSATMTAETEQKILSRLKAFEGSNLFLENTVFLPYLATYCETNTRYLSHVINNYKKKDFNNYINELRVTYIINKLKEVPAYRKYKLAVLSEEAGFSSQNKFSTVFKKVTTISPSVFIKYLEESEKN